MVTTQTYCGGLVDEEEEEEVEAEASSSLVTSQPRFEAAPLRSLSELVVTLGDVDDEDDEGDEDDEEEEDVSDGSRTRSKQAMAR